jgi:hypothetical protein
MSEAKKTRSELLKFEEFINSYGPAFSKIVMFEPYQVCYNKWFIDEYSGENLVFLSEDVASLSDDELIELIKSSPLVNNERNEFKISVRRAFDYTIVDFNIEERDLFA